MEKTEILDRIKAHLNISNNSDFARFLDVKPNVITNWYSRNTFNVELIHTKCVNVDANWLLTGKGNMLIKDEKLIKEEPLQIVAEPQADYASRGVPFWDLPVSAGKSVVDVVGKKKPNGYMYVPGIGRAENVFPVLGMSMGEEVPDGSYIGVCKINRWESLNTQRIYMIITRDDRMVKRIEYDEENEDIIWCISPNYPRFKVFKEEIIEIHRVCVVIAPK
ncbi:MAG: helix-turn-helix domain-containing protein [Mangrovibacterium sp.]